MPNYRNGSILFLFVIVAIAIASSIRLAKAIAVADNEEIHKAQYRTRATSNLEHDNGLTYQLYNNAVLSGSNPLYEGTTLSATLFLKPPNEAVRSHLPAEDLVSKSRMHKHEAGTFVSMSTEILSGSLKGSLSVLGTKKNPNPATNEKIENEIGEDDWYVFDCVFEGTSTGWVKIGHHIVCHDGNAYSYHQEYPLRLLPNKFHAFHAIITSNSTRASGNLVRSQTKPPNLAVYWKRASKTKQNTTTGHRKERAGSGHGKSLHHPLEGGFRPLSVSGQDDDLFVLHTDLPPNEIKRQDLQSSLSKGWGHWLLPDLLSLTKLPEGIVVGLQVCTRQMADGSRDCVGNVVPDSVGTVRVDRHSTDRSYASFNLTYVSPQSGWVKLTIETSVTGSDKEELRNLVTIRGCDFCEDFVLEVAPRYAWFRPGTASKSTKNALSFSTPGFQDVGVRVLVDKENPLLLRSSHNSTDDGNTITIPIPGPGHKIGLLAAPSSSLRNSQERLADLEQRIRIMARTDELAMKQSFGRKHKVAQAVRAAVMWSCIYNPIEEGPFMPVSRSPQWADTFASKAGATTPDWTYVVFEWDNLFASLMVGLFDKDLAYSNLFVSMQSKTSDGFLPNWSTAGGIRSSADRTEPPVGAKVLLELYRKYKDDWVVEALWEDLLDWNDWFNRERLLEPLGLIGLGSYQEHGSFSGDDQNNLQAARYESGLDNSPMYDGDEDFMYDKKTHMMQMYDVGMSSLVANEAYCLAELGFAVGMNRKEVQELRSCGDRLRDNVFKHLWDPSRNIFANRYREFLPRSNSSFVRSITPTSFYPLLLPLGNISFRNEGTFEKMNAHTAIESMVNSWLLNATRFCLSPNGNFEGNDPNMCYWGLPSVSADDPTYMATGHWNYWRGRVWGPMALIVFWSLQEESHSSSAEKSFQDLHHQYSNETFLRSHRRKVTSTNSSNMAPPPAIRKARKSLCSQMEALMMSQWNKNRHICENYSPFRNASECTGTLFYHWGALNGLIGMIEDGHYN